MDGLFETITRLASADVRLYSIVAALGESYTNLLLFTFGLFLYAVFVWHFYRKLAKKDLFELDLSKYRYDRGSHRLLRELYDVLAYVVEYLVLFPLYVSFWFGVMSLFLCVLVKGVDVQQIILFSAVLVGAIRMAAYYKEELAADLAKLLPLALIAILVMDMSSFSMEIAYGRILEIPSFLPLIIGFLEFNVLIELMLRMLSIARILVAERVMRR